MNLLPVITLVLSVLFASYNASPYISNLGSGGGETQASTGEVESPFTITENAGAVSLFFGSGGNDYLDFQTSTGVLTAYLTDSFVIATTTLGINGLTYKFPASHGSSGDVLSNNGAGLLSWTTLPADETASSTLLSDNNTFSGSNAFSGSTLSFTNSGATTLSKTTTGSINIAGTNGTGVTEGTDINITAGGHTGSTANGGGDVALNGGDGTAGGGNAGGGTVTLTGGNSGANAGLISIVGGAGGSEAGSNGGNVSITGGASGGSATGVAGNVLLNGGINSSSGTRNGYISLLTTSLERMRIAIDGNVGIGTSTPAKKLSIQGDGLFSGNLSVAGLTATGSITTALGTPAGTFLAADASGNIIATSTPSGGTTYSASSTAYSVSSGTATFTGSIPATSNFALGSITFNKTSEDPDYYDLSFARSGKTTSKIGLGYTGTADVCSYTFTWSGSNLTVEETTDTGGNCSISGTIYWYE